MVFGNFVLSGYYFGGGGPVLKLDDLETGERHILGIFDKKFSLTSQKEQRYCIGRFELGKGNSMPCPDSRKVGEKIETCRACFEAIGFNPSFYNVDRSELSDAQKEYSSKPHQVYLAYFAPGIVKVGISSSSRGRKRWYEQGARAVVDLGEFPDAYAARELEAKLSGRGFTETVRRDKKRKLLALGFDYIEAKKELQQMLQEQGIEGGIIDLSSTYRSDEIDDPTDVTKKVPVEISGTTVSQIGDILIMKQESGQFMLGLKDLVGYEVEISSKEIRLKSKRKQVSLF